MSKTGLNLMHADANRCSFTIVFNFIITSMTVKVIECPPNALVSSHYCGGREGGDPRTYTGMALDSLALVAIFRLRMGELDCFCTFVARSLRKNLRDSFCCGRNGDRAGNTADGCDCITINVNPARI